MTKEEKSRERSRGINNEDQEDRGGRAQERDWLSLGGRTTPPALGEESGCGCGQVYICPKNSKKFGQPDSWLCQFSLSCSCTGNKQWKKRDNSRSLCHISEVYFMKRNFITNHTSLIIILLNVSLLYKFFSSTKKPFPQLKEVKTARNLCRHWGF